MAMIYNKFINSILTCQNVSHTTSFIASRRWQLGLNFNPSYQLMSLSPEAYSVSGFSDNNALSAGATLDFGKPIEGTGGYAYASSNFAWSDFWLAYYRLCSLTLYDFYNMKPLE